MSIKVLVVDDSLFMRTLISDLLSSDPEITVIGTARSGDEAFKKIPKLRPDVITLDLVMPGTDGLATLKKIMASYPTPVVILSAYSREAADMTLECLHAGAVGFVVKPSGELSLDMDKVKKQLIAEVKSAALVDRKRLRQFLQGDKGAMRHESGVMRHDAQRIIVLGASTGGPQAIEEILSQLPADFPHTILVVQHMPNLSFTESFAHRLDRNCHLKVLVAEDKERVRGGAVYLAPSGFVMTLVKHSIVHLTPEASNGLTPSIDLVMKSVADLCGGKAVGVVLTGMGSDGLKGMRAIKEAGGRTIAQDESALIFGMPRVVIEEGLADQILPMEKIPELLVAMAAVEENHYTKEHSPKEKKQ